MKVENRYAELAARPRIRISAAKKGLACGVWLASTLVVVPHALPQMTRENYRVAVVLGSEAPELERYAAEQLCDYLKKLFGIEAQPTTSVSPSVEALFVLGSPSTNPAVKQATARHPFPRLSEEGIVLRRTEFQKHPALIVGGGSPRAALWAVYELVERWGVRYLLHGDVLPGEGGEFRLPDLDVVMEPKLPMRMWRVVNEHATGPISWGMADYRLLIDQLAKLKFNWLNVNIWPHGPFLDYEFKGIKRRSATLFWGYRYPITDDMVGRELFGNEPEFWNRDLPINASYEELTAAGVRLIHNLMAYGKQRGMQSAINANLSDFPPEFAPALKSAQRAHQVNFQTIAPGPDTSVDDPTYAALASTVLRALVNTYPEVDYVLVGMPEHHQWISFYEQAWKALDAKHGIEKVRPLPEVLAASAHRRGYSDTAERALREVKGNIVNLYFYDRLFRDAKVLQGTRRPDMRFMYTGVAEELYPVLARILPPGSAVMNFIDYNPARIVARQEVMPTMPSKEVPAVLVLTLADDNIGMVPQLELEPLAKLTQALIRYRWAGFSTRYWEIGDHDPTVAYLSKASWDANATAEGVAADLIRSLLGESCVEDMLTVFREVQEATYLYEWKDVSLAFPVPGMMMKHWKPGLMPAHLVEARQHYERALEAARRAQAKAQPVGRHYADYWVGRLEFGIGYLNTIEAVKRAATAEAEKKRAAALMHAKAALETARRAIQAYVRVVQDRADVGTIAVLNEYVYRPLQAKAAEVKK